ncbi:MAG: hypothetical protein IKZ19_04860, partial [Clostridia bacterium]|nr:hypothetical protein [Clostridia bacterium]
GAYYDAGKIEYKNEIIELGTELYTLHEYGNYKANAVSTVAKTYYAAGNAEKAIEWARKAHSVRYFKEFLCMQIYEEPDVLTTDFSVANYVYIESLFYMAMRLFEMKVCKPGEDYTQKVCKTVTEIYETVFPDDDMGYDFLYKLSILHLCIAEKESEIGKNEAVVKKHLTRAVECAIKSMSVKAHILDHPLICGVDVGSSPEKYRQTVNEVKREMRKEVFSDYHSRPWFISLEAGLAKATV